MWHSIRTSDRLLTLILMLKWYISAKWTFPSPPCSRGNGVENDKLYAIISLENQRSIHDSVKSGFNDVRRFLGGREGCFTGPGTVESWWSGMCAVSGETKCFIKAAVLCSTSAPRCLKFLQVKLCLLTFRISEKGTNALMARIGRECGGAGDDSCWYAPVVSYFFRIRK